MDELVAGVMSRQAKALLYYLARYLAADTKRRARLIAHCKKLTGKPLDLKTLWRHVKLQREPTMGMTLVYLAFLHREKAIVCSDSPKQFFLYPYFTREGRYAEPVKCGSKQKPKQT